MLFATYRFLIKLQMLHDDDAKDQQRRPTLGQIFLAGAGCCLASTYVPFLPSSSPPKEQIMNFRLSPSPQTSHDADRTCQDPTAKASTAPLLHQQIREARIPCAHACVCVCVCASRCAAYLLSRWHPRTPLRAFRNHLARRRRIRTLLPRGALPSFFPPKRLPKKSPHAPPQKKTPSTKAHCDSLRLLLVYTQRTTTVQTRFWTTRFRGALGRHSSRVRRRASSVGR